jgi:hypothetical protein
MLWENTGFGLTRSARGGVMWGQGGIHEAQRFLEGHRNSRCDLALPTALLLVYGSRYDVTGAGKAYLLMIETAGSEEA